MVNNENDRAEIDDRVSIEVTSRSSEATRRVSSDDRIRVLVFILCVLLVLALAPSLGGRIAYFMTLGSERAKMEVAEQFLKAHPESSESFKISYVAKLVGPSVVGIKTNSIQSDFFGASSIAQGQGSGVIVDSSGLIITNFHVICEQGRLVDGVEIGLSDGRVVSDGIQLVGFDEKLDIAVLKIEVNNLSAIQWGNSDDLEVGDSVIALGNPYGLAHTVTKGIVSAKERFVYDSNGVASQEFLQTDAAVNPGNSGGALVDEQGRLVGINTAIYGQQYQGISFSLPVNRVRAVFDEIVGRK